MIKNNLVNDSAYVGHSVGLYQSATHLYNLAANQVSQVAQKAIETAVNVACMHDQVKTSVNEFFQAQILERGSALKESATQTLTAFQKAKDATYYACGDAIDATLEYSILKTICQVEKWQKTCTQVASTLNDPVLHSKILKGAAVIGLGYVAANYIVSKINSLGEEFLEVEKAQEKNPKIA